MSETMTLDGTGGTLGLPYLGRPVQRRGLTPHSRPQMALKSATVAVETAARAMKAKADFIVYRDRDGQRG